MKSMLYIIYWRRIMKKICLFVFLMLLINLLSGCGLPSHLNDEEISSENGTQNADVQPTQAQDSQALPGSEEASSVKTESESAPDVAYETDTGVFQGRIDNNFIEIAVSDVQKEETIKVFMLSDEVRQEFDSMELDIGEVVKFQYYKNENEQNVIVKIEKLK